MRTYIKIGAFIITFLCSGNVAFGQRLYKDIRDALMNQGNFSGKGAPTGVNWIENGNKYSYIENSGAIKIFDPANLSEVTLFESKDHTFPDNKPFSYESFEWSADSKFILFKTNFRSVWRHSGISDYYLYSLNKNTLKLVTKNAYTAQLSPDGRKLVFERGGNLYLTDLNTDHTRQLTGDAKPFFYNGRFGWEYEEEFGLVQAWVWSHDSQHIAFWQSDETQAPIFQYTNYIETRGSFEKVPYPKPGEVNPHVRIGVIDVGTGRKRWIKVDCGDGYIPRIYWTADPGKLAVVHLNRKQNDMRLLFADIVTGEARQILEEKSDQWVQIFSFAVSVTDYFNFPASDKEFFWLSERDGWMHIYRYDYAGKLVNQVTKGKWEVERFLHVDAAKKLVYYSSSESSPFEKELYMISFDGTGKKRLTKAPGVHHINFSSGGNYFIDNYSSVDQPARVDLCDDSGSLLKRLQDNTKVLAYTKEVEYIPTEIQSFTTSDGQKIDFSIVKPYHFSLEKKYPVLFNVYGGPEFQAVSNEFSKDAWMQYMAQLGYVIVKVNNRGSASYGRDFKKIVYGRLGEYECKDFAETARYLSTFPWVDKDRIGIYGHSYGGFTSSFSILNYPDVFKVAIVGSPVTDWRNYDAIYTERYMGVLPENTENYNKSAVLSYVKNYMGRMLIVHSTFDDNVHVINTMQLLAKLIEAGKDADLKLYQLGGHGIANDFNSYILLHEQYIDFLNRYLKPNSLTQ